MSEEGATIHLYSQDSYLPQAAAEALQRLSTGAQQQGDPGGGGQQFSISFSNGQTVLTPIDNGNVAPPAVIVADKDQTNAGNTI